MTFFHSRIYILCVTKPFRRMPNCHPNVFNSKKGWFCSQCSSKARRACWDLCHRTWLYRV